MHHSMQLMNRPYVMIKSLYKTIELRLNDEKRKFIKQGDTIEFINKLNGEKIIVLVKQITKYKDFDSLYKQYSKESMGYKADEVANPKDMLLYYSEDQVTKYGVVAIEIALKD